MPQLKGFWFGATILLLSCLISVNATANTVTVNNLSRHNILVLGDSISAAYGIAVEQGWVALLQQRLVTQAPQWRVINASISGETTSGGIARLKALLARHQPNILVIELGGNDALRGTPLATIRANLKQMLTLGAAHEAEVLLLGMRIPPNYGPYAKRFHALYGALARQYQAQLVDFFLKDVAGIPGMMQADGIHPTLQAQKTLLENVWPTLASMLRAGTL